MELKADQGLGYNNGILNKIADILKSKQTLGTAYHPQTIGTVGLNFVLSFTILVA